VLVDGASPLGVQPDKDADGADFKRALREHDGPGRNGSAGEEIRGPNYAGSGEEAGKPFFPMNSHSRETIMECGGGSRHGGAMDFGVGIVAGERWLVSNGYCIPASARGGAWRMTGRVIFASARA
jgi:hypothetical protein